MHEIPVLDRKGLRQFGLIFGAIIGVVFGLLLPWVWEWSFPVWPWIVTGVFGAWAIAAPDSINPFYKLWMKLGFVINWVITRIVLGTVFFGLMLPMGLIMRLKGHDPMKRKLHGKESSYRKTSEEIPKRNMEKPF